MMTLHVQKMYLLSIENGDYSDYVMYPKLIYKTEEAAKEAQNKFTHEFESYFKEKNVINNQIAVDSWKIREEQYKKAFLKYSSLKDIDEGFWDFYQVNVRIDEVRVVEQ